jgi:4-hydroxy-2-oxoheptanedioate aldolase
MWLYLHDPAVVDLIGAAGFDYVGIETEHGSQDFSVIRNHIYAARANNLGTLIRTGTRDRAIIQRLLDLNVEGLTFPHIKDATEAAEMIAACRFAPIGNRGVSGGIAGSGTHNMSSKELAQWNNEHLVVGVMIEDLSALDDIDNIARLPGLSFVQVGAGDLSAALGHRGEPGSPEVQAAFKRVEAACKRAKVPLAYMLDHPGYSVPFPELLDAGYRLIVCGKDTDLLRDSLRAVSGRVKLR